MNDTIEYEGVTYISVPEIEESGCSGCSLNSDITGDACFYVQDNKSCYKQIWIKKEDMKSQESKSLTKGVKHDSDKIQWWYLPIAPMQEVLKALTYGDKKYPADDGANWKHVPNAKKRYYSAMLRHITSWWDGEKNDPETGYNHLAHAITNALFLLYFEMKGYPDEKS